MWQSFKEICEALSALFAYIFLEIREFLFDLDEIIIGSRDNILYPLRAIIALPLTMFLVFPSIIGEMLWKIRPEKWR